MIREATHGTSESRTEEMRPRVGEEPDDHGENRVEGVGLDEGESWGSDGGEGGQRQAGATSSAGRGWRRERRLPYRRPRR